MNCNLTQAKVPLKSIEPQKTFQSFFIDSLLQSDLSWKKDPKSITLSPNKDEKGITLSQNDALLAGTSPGGHCIK